MKGRDAVSFWLENAGRYPVLPVATVLHLSKQIQTLEEDDPRRKKAIDKLIKHNLKLIPQQVRRIVKARKCYTTPGATQEDLLQAGVLGLQKAAEKYDYTRGYAFSTYAVNWIYQQIQRTSYANLSIVRVPENTLNEFYRAHNSQNKADISSLSENVKKRFDDAKLALFVRSADQTQHNRLTHESYDCHLGSYYDAPLLDSVTDIFKLCPALSTLEKKLVIGRAIEGKDYKELGAKYSISSHYASKLIRGALQRLRQAMNQID